jgi:hypothetical protein
MIMKMIPAATSPTIVNTAATAPLFWRNLQRRKH